MGDAAPTAAPTGQTRMIAPHPLVRINANKLANACPVAKQGDPHRGAFGPSTSRCTYLNARPIFAFAIRLPYRDKVLSRAVYGARKRGVHGQIWGTEIFSARVRKVPSVGERGVSEELLYKCVLCRTPLKLVY